MTKRLSLYFEPYAWERMNRYLSYMLLSGKPLYELPTMNDLIEAMVVYVSREILVKAVEPKDFLPFFDGIPFNVNKDKLYSMGKDKGRIAFNFTDITETAVSEIRRIDTQYKSEGEPEGFLTEGATDPLVIRASVYYVVTDFRPKFIEQLYFSFLYNIRPSMLSAGDLRFDLEHMTEQEKANFRKIAWDDSILDPLFSPRHRTTSPPPKKGMSREYDLAFFTLLNSEDYPSPFVSRGFGFNYKYACIGYYAMSRGVGSEDFEIPELLTYWENPIVIDDNGRGAISDYARSSLYSYMNTLKKIQSAVQIELKPKETTTQFHIKEKDKI